MIERYPLQWPANKPRTPTDQRKRALFNKKNDNGWKTQISVADGVKRVETEFDMFTKVGHDYRIPPESIIISTNVPPTKKGRPMSGLSEPEDTGVAVYFKLDGKDYCFECDKWDRVADNLAAIAGHALAMRKIEYWGVGQQHDVYTGFKALPQNAGISNGAWWDVLGVPSHATKDEIKEAYRLKVSFYHPDKPTGNRDMFDLVQKAYKEATA